MSVSESTIRNFFDQCLEMSLCCLKTMRFAACDLDLRSIGSEAATEVTINALKGNCYGIDMEVPSTAAPLIYKATSFRAYDFWEKRKTEQTKVLAYAESSSGSRDTCNEQRGLEDKEFVNKLLLLISCEDAAIIRMRMIEEMGFAEIAALLACNVGAARTRYMRAKDCLVAAVRRKFGNQ